MKFSTLALIIGIVMLLVVASAQSRSATAATPPCPQPGTFNVYVLAPNFTPYLPYSSTPPTYASPTSSTTLTAGSAMATDLGQAFAIAPPFFQQQLCLLDGVFINTNDCTSFDNSTDVCSGPSPGTALSAGQITTYSWGYREGPWQFALGSPPGHYGRYIAISAGPWSSAGQHAPPYSGYEGAVLNLLLPWPSGAMAPKYGTANSGADIPAMAVLAALAHEFGHVLWYDKFRPTAGGSYDFDTFCHGTFYANSWGHVGAPPLWRQFGDIQNSHHPSDVNIAEIALALLGQKFLPAGSLLHRIYGTKGRWASLFAAFSPDEDFVETFKFYVLTNAVSTDAQNNPHALASLPITIPGDSAAGPTTYKDDIPRDYVNRSKSELTRKAMCIQEEFNP
jgi:hypothetical protein